MKAKQEQDLQLSCIQAFQLRFGWFLILLLIAYTYFYFDFAIILYLVHCIRRYRWFPDLCSLILILLEVDYFQSEYILRNYYSNYHWIGFFYKVLIFQKIDLDLCLVIHKLLSHLSLGKYFPMNFAFLFKIDHLQFLKILEQLFFLSFSLHQVS